MDKNTDTIEGPKTPQSKIEEYNRLNNEISNLGPAIGFGGLVSLAAVVAGAYFIMSKDPTSAGISFTISAISGYITGDIWIKQYMPLDKKLVNLQKRYENIMQDSREDDQRDM
jgi:hypothetical protein